MDKNGILSVVISITSCARRSSFSSRLPDVCVWCSCVLQPLLPLPSLVEIEKVQKDEGKEEEKFIDVVINKNMKLGQKVLIPVKQFPKVSVKMNENTAVEMYGVCVLLFLLVFVCVISYNVSVVNSLRCFVMMLLHIYEI